MTHLFKIINPPDQIFVEYKNYSLDSWKICTKCKLIVGKIQTIEYFFINNLEIFKEVTQLNEINLTCDEFIIKSIIE
jgi:hypothetical protein